MRYYCRVVYVICFLCFIVINCNSQQLYSIPWQTIKPLEVLKSKLKTSGSVKVDMHPFQISSLITYHEYKEYLLAIKKDSSHKFYLSQLPDSTMCLPDVYKEYTTGNQYDNYPVMGISWDAAMNYCRWKTKVNNKDSIQYIYRLPCESEWLAAYNYLNNASIKNDFNKDYSDWLLNAFDEDAMMVFDTAKTNHWDFDYVHLALANEPDILKRKVVIGDSYLFKLPSLSDYNNIAYFSFKGYRQIGFRYIKEPIDTTTTIHKFRKPEYTGDKFILKSWGLK